MLDRFFSFGGLLRHVGRVTLGVVRNQIKRHVGPLPGLPGRGAREIISIPTTRRPAPEPGGAGDVKAHEELPAVDRVLIASARRLMFVCFPFPLLGLMRNRGSYEGTSHEKTHHGDRFLHRVDLQ